MKSIDEAQAQATFDEIIDEVEQQPIAIRRQGQEVAILLSMADYKRLRVGAIREFLDVRNDIALEAGATGLTEERLSRLLNNS